MHRFVAWMVCLLPVCGWGLTFSAQSALATASTQEQFFTLDSFIRIYLANSPELKVRTNSLKISRNNYKNAFTNAFLPSFSVGASADKTYSRANRPSSWDEFTNANSSASASGSWTLFNSGKDTLNYKSASLDFQIEQINFDSGVQQFVLSAVQTYFDLLLEQKLLQVRKDDLEVVTKQYELDKKLYDNGIKTRSDLLQSETSWRSSQLSLFSAENDYANTLKNFNIAINRPVEAGVALDETIQLDLPQLPPLAQDITTALAHRYDARVERLRLKQADISQTLGRLDSLPSVFVNLFASTGRGFNSHELWDYNYGISAGISFDIGFFYLDKYRSRQNVDLRHSNELLEHEQFLRTLRDQVVQARNTLDLQMRSLEISKLRLEAATQKYEATQLKYKNGLMSATDLTFARQELINAQVEYVTLQCDLTLTRLRYRYALGEKIYDYQPEDL